MSLTLPDAVDAVVVGGGWQDRWDEFRLVTPNWTASFPGWAYDGADPDGFMTRDEIAARVADRQSQVGRVSAFTKSSS